MVIRVSDWKDELGRWLKPFLDRLGHKARRQMCPLYVSGLIGPGDRKSIQPMAKRLALGEYDQQHHFIAAGVWDVTPVETELLVQADRLVGGRDAVLVIDDTAIPKKGTHSVGVAAQYASGLHAQAKLKAYRIGEVEFIGALPSDYLPTVRKAIEDAHGRSLRTLNGRVVSIEGREPAGPNVAIVEWDSLDDAVAFYKSKAWTDLAPQRARAQITKRRYVVEVEK